MNTWEEIRANWVNGNLSDVKAAIRKMPKAKALAIIEEALRTYYSLLDLSSGTASGDLTDLLEILRAVRGV